MHTYALDPKSIQDGAPKCSSVQSCDSEQNAVHLSAPDSSPTSDNSGYSGPLVPIPLTRGYFALIDLADYERVSAIKWRVRITKDGQIYGAAHAPGSGHRGRTIQMHRFIVGAGPGDPRIDHKDGDGLHNWRTNLRPASNAQNIRNQRTHVGPKSSPFKGVSKTRAGKFRAQIMADYKKKNLGEFTEELTAARVYDAAARELHGQFARCNFPLEAI